MKIKTCLLSLAILLIMAIIFYSFFAENYIAVPERSSKQNITEQNSNGNLTTNAPVEKEKNPLEFNENLLIDNKPILDMSYSDVINSFGQPNKVIKEKASFPASDTEDYNKEGAL